MDQLVTRANYKKWFDALLDYSYKSLRHTNTLMTFELDISISMSDMSRLIHGSYTSDLHKKTFPATICTNKETGGTLNLFTTGKIVIGGLNSDFHTILSAELFLYRINSCLPVNAKLVTMQKQPKTNDVYTFWTLYKIDVQRYYEDNKHNTKVTGKFDNISTKIGQDSDQRKVSLIIFATGKINVIGIRREVIDISFVLENSLKMLTNYFIEK